MSEKPNRQDVPSLLVVATPLGNLGDLSPRARDALARVALVCAEDTRVARQLYAALDLEVPELIAIDAHRERSKNLTVAIEKIRSAIAEGRSAALITDAGTPAVSDPGAALVAACRTAELRVTCVPGPSALTAALSICGLEASRVFWNGFFARRPQEEVERLRDEGLSGLHVWFESPERIEKTSSVLGAAFPEATIWIGKELTKIHERSFFGSASAVATQLAELSPVEKKGEWVICLRHEFEPKKISQNFDSALTCLAEAGVSLSQAVAITQKQFDARHRDVYESALKIFKSSKKNDTRG